MPARTRLAASAVQKNGRAKAVIGLSPGGRVRVRRPASGQLRVEIVEMRQVAPRSDVVTGRGHYGHPDPGLPVQKLAGVEREVGLLENDGRLLLLDDVHDVVQVLARRRDAGDR